MPLMTTETLVDGGLPKAKAGSSGPHRVAPFFP